MTERSCSACACFEPLHSGATGNCHRFPRAERVTPEYWCMEYRPLAEPELADNDERFAELAEAARQAGGMFQRQLSGADCLVFYDFMSKRFLERT